MVDINSTLLIQLANFLVLLLALNLILIKPLLRIMRERELGISTAFTDGKNAQERMQRLLEQYNASLADAKQKATAAYGALYQQGLDSQRELIYAERTRAGETLDKARAEIAAAAATARTDLKQEADRLSQDITAKLLGRAV
jgi:F-type H+-transporting ATPase subunit b